MSNIASISTFLTSRLRRSQAKELGQLNERRAEHFAGITGEVCFSTDIYLAREAHMIHLDTEPCDRQIESILLQKQDDHLDKPIAHWSKI